MAALVLESIAVPRTSVVFQKAAAVSPSPHVSLARSLPDCRSLRIAGRPGRVSPWKAVARRDNHRGVVCEVQNTTIGNVAPILCAHLAATKVSRFRKFEEMSETSSAHGEVTSAVSIPVPELPHLHESKIGLQGCILLCLEPNHTDLHSHISSAFQFCSGGI